jgi:hypothetical protein
VCCRAAPRLFDCTAQIALGLCGVVEALNFAQGYGCQHRSCPGSEILCRDIFSGDCLEILVHVARRDVLAIALFIDVLKQFLSRELLTGPDNPGDAPVS